MKVWGIPATALLWLIPLVRAFGAFDDVITGLIADQTNTRWGKFRPYLDGTDVSAPGWPLH